MSENGRKNTVLVVDDSPENIDLLGNVLKWDYEIKVALNGEKALKICGSENPPDIILLWFSPLPAVPESHSGF